MNFIRIGIIGLLLLQSASALHTAEPAPKPKAKPNRLAQESSPYLLQHAYNPVDWHAWNAETLAKAKKENKLIFLSIGYSSCHWCHVMERESFSDAGIAKTLNENFICIKVDREERPDIDEVFMTALQVLGSNGGWPLSMFLSPTAKPIFGGTYWPPDDKKIDAVDTIPGFKSVLARVILLNKDKHDDLMKQADNVANATAESLERATLGLALVKLDAELIREAVGNFDLDPEHGGLGSSARGYRGTKFPRVSAFHFLMQQSQKKDHAETAKLVNLTLEKMAQGGIYDHLGGGFHRYSTERTWTVPHFEKMLYDQAQLVELYANAQAIAPKPSTERTIRESLEFVQRELTAPEGYFYSALDADSEEKEGEFYVWTEKQLDDLLGADAKFFKSIYATDPKNFEGKQAILRLDRPLAAIAAEQKISEAELLKKLAPIQKKLFDVRAKRERPFLDTKLIVAWNGQMIAGYARAGKVLNEPKYLATAEKAAEFIWKTMRDKDGRLLRIFAAKPGEKATARGPSFLDDHAFLLHGFIVLHEATGKKEWLTRATELMELTEKWYGDANRGGYFGTPSDGEKLFARGKDGYDGAQPSCNGVMALNLVRLAAATKNEALRTRAEKLVRLYGRPLKSAPTSVPLMASAVDMLLAQGALKEEVKPALPVAPANPKNSSDVASVVGQSATSENGIRTYHVVVKVAKDWHVYANPVGSKDLAEAQTSVEILIDGKPVKPEFIEFPAGTIRKEPTGNYNIYEGETTIRFGLNTATLGKSKLSVKVKVVACNEKNCLLPSTFRLDLQ